MNNQEPQGFPISLDVQPFEVRLLNCVVTREMAPCIVVKLAELESTIFDEETGKPILEEEGEPKKSIFELFGQFSERGLNILLDKLHSAPFPATVASPEDVRRQNPYMWMVVLKSGQRIFQYLETGEETSFGAVHIPDVQQFWIVPQTGMEDLPAYGLLQDQGFVTVSDNGGPIVSLDLPWPKGQPFWTQYYRQVWRKFTTVVGNVMEHPVYMKQILGWRIEEEGNAVIFEIAINDDGSYQVWKKEPLDYPHFENYEPQSTMPESFT